MRSLVHEEITDAAGTSESHDHAGVGLALSGGGLRAAFFHVGVLAHLADRGILKRVELISTVSGGSIVGTLFFLHVKALLETKHDHEITDADYVAIVQKVYQRLLAQGQRNFRWSTFQSWSRNVKMRRDNYSRSDSIGMLYEERLFRGILPGPDRPLFTMDLAISPKGTPAGIRVHKVPTIQINATSLNTGHHWRFDGHRMGEAEPAEAYHGIDQNGIFPSQRYRDFSADEQRLFPLGIAVAASAAVPLIFPPLSVTRAFDEQVQLVDGGVHDNQGIQALVESDLKTCIVSDASGQMRDAMRPSTRLLGVGRRVKSVLEDRLREEQLFRVVRQFGKEGIIIHLRQRLPPKRAKALIQKADDTVSVPIKTVPVPRFHIDPRVQHYLSKIRTDLDTFTEAEAAALACNGYALLANRLDEAGYRQEPEVASSQWAFMAMQGLLAVPTTRFLDHLAIANRTFWKPFLLDPSLRLSTALLAGALVLSGAVNLVMGRLGLGAALALSGSLLGSLVLRRIRPDEDALTPRLGDALMQWLYPVRAAGNIATVAVLWAVSHAWRPFDARYAKAGRLDRLLRRPGKVEPPIPEEVIPILARK